MFQSILCPVDTSEPGLEQKALSVAKLLAEANGASITLLAVVPDMPVMAAEYLPADFHKTQMSEFRRVLEDIATASGLPKERVRTKVRIGRPYHEILEEAQASHADLIVMASHRPRLATYLLGSNAAHVVRHATCSVMALRPEAA
ncbi:MAG: universal stress protein [Phreatobacter sp.]|uniref:universal stress protein n=1 Tax=Phreatobacter sp. TaxID=1966341 RepID=UPI00273751D7|nr:universal stress protein [Phreatobacter sp.]MDP2800496.1 universal stress protein [Phreatobacter sp.]